ncbi:hypothetical protein CKAN_02339900 [Cinnamomum micranthum f. kanehirae]|uniref:Protein YeeZ n=1 Tax=Cinnamomum micranthum f. kanehirae TaxID=337451 RepID=A0A3S3R410_9MAGN|nr:hypothetical protein CKAN_02339900 [Cinnamomum micranthum f. kanehirae]
MEIIAITPIARQPSIYFLSTNLSPSFSLPKALFSSTSSSIPYRKNRIAKRGLSIAMALQSSSASPALGSSATNEMSGVSSSGFIGENDLLIVGPGVLGCMVAEKWQEEHPGCQIFGQTMTTDHHVELMKMGIKPSLRGSQALHQFPYVIFCAPPSRSKDYPGDVRLAASNWNGKGSLLFTSSSASYDCNDNGSCDEDAASLSIAIMKKKLRGRIFLGCDNHPLSRQEIMDLVDRSGKFSKKFEGFTGTNDPLGKCLNNSKTRAEIGWEPKYASFAQFLGLSE